MGVMGDAIPQGYFYQGVIAVPPASKLADLELNLEGSAELVTASNWTDNQQLLSRGDTVRVSKRASDGTYVVTGVIRAKTNVYTRNHRLFIDKFDIAGFGVNSYLHEKADGGFRVYQPNKEVLEIPAPGIGSYDQMMVYGNNVYAWMLDGTSINGDERRRLFRFLKGSLFWEEVGYLPTLESNHYLHYFINETFSRPIIATINRSSLSHPGGVAPMGFILQVDRLVTPGQELDSTSYAMATAPIDETSAAYLPQVSAIVNEDHMFVEVRAGSGSKAYHVNLATDAVTELSDSTIYQYMGARAEGDLDAWSPPTSLLNQLRLSNSGDLYRGFVQSENVPLAAIYERRLGSPSPTVNPIVTADEVIVGRLFCQRDKNSSTFYVSGRIEVDVDGGEVERREAMWKVVSGSSIAVLKPGAGPAAASYSPMDSTSAIPIQHPDGTITAVVDLSISAGQQWGLELRTFASEFG
jgi:hypothetical protein